MLTKNKKDIKLKEEAAAKLKQIKARQQKWLDERKQAHENETLKQNECYSTKTEFNSSSPTSRQVYRPYDYQSPYSDPTSTADSIADEIIHNARSQLGISSSKADARNSIDRIPEKKLSAHNCCSCQDLMMSPGHAPFMLVPCGHNLCEKCCKDADFCSLCAAEIHDFTHNVILEQIIKSKHTKSTPSKPHTTKIADKSQNIQTLLLRKEALNEELGDISKTVKTIKRQIQEENEQITSIERKEAEIIKEISSLQRKLAVLQDHKQEFKDKIANHQQKIKSEQSRRDLTSETISYLSSQLAEIGYQD